jgi:hypothetical protein
MVRMGYVSVSGARPIQSLTYPWSSVPAQGMK